MAPLKCGGEQLFRSYKFMYGLDYVALRYFNATVRVWTQTESIPK